MVRAKTALFLVYSAVATAVYHPKIDRRLSERESNTVMKEPTTRHRLQEPNRGKIIKKIMTAEVEEETRRVLNLLQAAPAPSPLPVGKKGKKGKKGKE